MILDSGLLFWATVYICCVWAAASDRVWCTEVSTQWHVWSTQAMNWVQCELVLGSNLRLTVPAAPVRARNSWRRYRH